MTAPTVTGARVIAANPGCQRQLIAAVRRARLRTRVVHLAELVAMAQAASADK